MPEPAHTGILIAGGTAAAGALGGLFRWMLGRQIRRIDEHDDRLDEIEKTNVTKTDLTHMESRITAAINQTATHIGERLGDVKATAEKAHDRLDRMQR